KGSEVVVEIERPGVSDPFEVTIVRDEIPLETVYKDTKKIDGKLTGILEITSFSETTGKEFTEALQALEDDGIEGLVIDVRGNPGGVLDTVESVLGHFVPKDVPMVQMEDAEGNREPHSSDLESKKD